MDAAAAAAVNSPAEAWAEDVPEPYAPPPIVLHGFDASMELLLTTTTTTAAADAEKEGAEETPEAQLRGLLGILRCLLLRFPKLRERANRLPAFVLHKVLLPRSAPADAAADVDDDDICGDNSVPAPAAAAATEGGGGTARVGACDARRGL